MAAVSVIVGEDNSLILGSVVRWFFSWKERIFLTQFFCSFCDVYRSIGIHLYHAVGLEEEGAGTAGHNDCGTAGLLIDFRDSFKKGGVWLFFPAD